MASLMWGGALWAVRALGLASWRWTAANEASAPEAAPAPESAKPETSASKRKRRATSARPSRPARSASGEATTGDPLDLDGARELDLEGSGGEEQLREHEIEQAFDRNFTQIRRCLVLAASDQPVRGTVTFGLRISGKTGISRVQLTGPRAVTTGEAGECLRKAARGLRLRRFDGPDMVVHYPLVLQ